MVTKKWALFPALILLTIVSCTKPDDVIPPEPEPEVEKPEDPTTLQLIADSIFLFSKEIYYWKDTTIGPVSYATFNPRQYVKTDELTTAQATLEAVRNYSYYDSTKGFSYAEAYFDAEEKGGRAATKETGYGFNLKEAWKNRSVNPTYRPQDFQGWYVNYVFPDSDAGKKGVQRGMKLAIVNGSRLEYTQGSVDIINDMFYHERLKSVDAQFVKSNGDTLKITVSSSSFEPESVIYSSIISTEKNSKAGYLVYQMFDNLNSSKVDLDAVFQEFKTAGVKNVILDLRYNRGGYTATQDYLTNHLAPAGANGTMYTFYYNNDLQKNDYTLMKTRGNFDFRPERNFKNFSLSSLSVTPEKLYVIVGDNTASSSELLINNLKPVFGNNLVLIGDANTYGKPVGFFPIDLFEKVTFWTVSFTTKNRATKEVSYDGFEPNYKIYDGVDKVWGDKTEDCVATALKLIDGVSIINTSSNLKTTARSVMPLKQLKIKRKERLMDNMLFTKQN